MLDTLDAGLAAASSFGASGDAGFSPFIFAARSIAGFENNTGQALEAVRSSSIFATHLAALEYGHLGSEVGNHASLARATEEGEAIYNYAFWEAISEDCESPRIELPLWRRDAPGGWLLNWYRARERLLAMDPSYAVWIDWYDRRVLGEESAFDIPGDVDRKEDTAILRKLAEATDEDFWGKGATYVNTTLQGWIDEARARCLPPVIAEVSGDFEISGSAEGRVGPAPSQIAEALERQASPQARIIDGKLDAVPNAVFDKPQYSDNLATLPSEMMAFADVILGSLPRNCEPLVRNCFAGHRDELLVRGNRPILNILKGMSASLIAEIYIEADLTVSPDEWVLRDPREWGAGLAAMFAQFFKGHLDLVHHFPLDEEREELIANTPIDEVAASGDALTKPVDDVAEEIAKLGERGDVTENFLRIVEAMRLYNRDIAQLPASSSPTEIVTPKRRHVLMTAGFYVNTLGVLGSAASLYALSGGTYTSLIAALQRAVDALLSFVV